ncbi:MAG: cupin domain-containing protein [Bacteroidota bacterium]
MKTCFSIFLILFLLSMTAQEVAKPILFDKAALSGIGLEKIELKDAPERNFFRKQLYRGEELSAYIVSLDTGTSSFKNFGFDEYIEILHGEATVLPNTSKAQTFYSRDLFFAPKGFRGDWFINAGSNFHYEISVISTQRADTSLVRQNATHELISHRMLSGTFMDVQNKPIQKEVLLKGAELTISVTAEKPHTKTIQKNKREMIIKLLSGQITITDTAGEEYIFYSGDYFALPLAFKGSWSSQGHGLVKYLTLETSDF